MMCLEETHFLSSRTAETAEENEIYGQADIRRKLARVAKVEDLFKLYPTCVN